MAKVETRLDRDPTGATESAPVRESFADRVLALAAMAGAVSGAIGGAVLGAEIGTACPVMCGTLGTMIGSGSTAGAWCLLAPLFAGRASGPARPTVTNPGYSTGPSEAPANRAALAG